MSTVHDSFPSASEARTSEARTSTMEPGPKIIKEILIVIDYRAQIGKKENSVARLAWDIQGVL